MSSAVLEESVAPAVQTATEASAITAVDILFEIGQGYDFRLVTGETPQVSPGLKRVTLPPECPAFHDHDLALWLLRYGHQWAPWREGTWPKESRHCFAFVSEAGQLYAVIAECGSLPEGADPDRLIPVDFGPFMGQIQSILESDRLAGTPIAACNARVMGEFFLAGMHAVHSIISI